ncbi:MAG: hypothetical protein Q4E12_03720 [Coriobacteriia bacterium]|nr:hypothetical protein [Coriobacteriia bacterium]
MGKTEKKAEAVNNRQTTHSNGPEAGNSNSEPNVVNDTTRLAAWRAVNWTKGNPQAWAFVRGLVIADARADRRPSAQDAVRVARGKDFTDESGKRTCYSHTLVPAWGRIIEADLLAQGEFEAAGRVRAELRPSRFDGPGMPWDVVRRG